MRYIKTFESYSGIDDYLSSVKDLLKNYNITPIQINDIVNSYEIEIENYFNDGKFPQVIVDKIKNDLKLDNSGGYMGISRVKGPSSNYHSHSTN